MIAVPRAEIRAEFNAVLPASGGEFSDDVAFAFFPRRFFDAVLRRFRRPCAPAVMVLRRVNHSRHSGFLEGFDDGVRVEIRRIEQRRAFVAVAPLASGERIQPEMRERVKFEPLPLHLLLGRRRAVRLRRRRLMRGNRGLRRGIRGGNGKKAARRRDGGEPCGFFQRIFHEKYFRECGGSRQSPFQISRNKKIRRERFSVIYGY